MQSQIVQEFIKLQFPTLAESANALFDNAGGSLPCLSAIESVQRYMIECPVQLGASYDLSQRARRTLKASTEAAKQLLTDGQAGTLSDEQVIFGSSSTQLLNTLSMAIAHNIGEGDEIIVTNFDHEANIGAWRRLEQRGVQIKEWRINSEDFSSNSDKLESLLSSNTRLVAFTHASNILGQALPIKTLCQKIRAAGAISVVDGVAYAPHRPLDVLDWGVDFYVFSLYKVFGPHCAILYARHDRLHQLNNLNHFFHERADTAVRLQPGAFAYELAAGTSGVVNYLHELGKLASGSTLEPLASAWKFIADKERTLTVKALEILAAFEQVKVIGPTEYSPARLPLVSFITKDRPSAEAPAQFEKHKVALRFGHFYAHRLMQALNLDPESGVVRLSLAHYNSLEELDLFAHALEDWIKG